MIGRVKRFFIYAKVTAVGLLFLAVFVLVAQNWGYKTRFWLWPGAADREVPTLWLILITSILSILVFWILSKTRRVFAELAEIRAQRTELKEQAAHQARNKELEERERRIDEKVKQALVEKNPQNVV